MPHAGISSLLLILGIILIIGILYLVNHNNYAVSRNTSLESFFQPKTESHIPHIIWIVWDKSIDQSPILIQDCIANIYRLNPGWKIHVVDPDKWDTFVKDPQVLKQIRNSTHSKNHISDLLRVYLLKTYGGVYIDASIVLFKSLDWVDTIPSGYAALYRADKWSTNEKYPVLESWFMASPANHPFINDCCKMMLDIMDQQDIPHTLKQLKSKKNIDYQGFMHHDEYHVFYFILMYIWQSSPDYKIIAIPCPLDSEMCKYVYTNKNLKHLLHTPLTSQQKDDINNMTMLKLTGLNRRTIAEKKWKPVKNSILDIFNIRVM